MHDNQGQLNYDHFRNQVLNSKGYSVVRIDNVSVIDYTEAALEWIKDREIKGSNQQRTIRLLFQQSLLPCLRHLSQRERKAVSHKAL
ncbi:DUF559 domain-containing protein [Pedobacter superstes]|uniref:DUF559 domain-containing protein n=1 Tax=Pedobacter superstes TaxID=3133441 RepID=UPI003D7403A0